jgi:lipoprotein-releasing system ATP-binding protein
VAAREPAERAVGSGDRKVLVAQGLVRRLGQGAAAREVLRGVTLAIGEGEFTALVGPSGSGKSTLLYLLGGLDHPDAGSVEIAGNPLAGIGGDALAKLRNRLVGFVYQFHFLLPEFSALENVLMPLWARGGGRSRVDRAWGGELLDRVGLASAARKLPRELSGGEQQRVAVARAVVNRPRLLLADEPTGNLDSVNARTVYELFRELNRDMRQTILVVTHDAGWAARSDRVLHLLDGVLVGDERKGESG